MLAPITIKYKEPTVLIVVHKASFNKLSVSWPLTKMNNKTSTTQTAALSVAVKKPR